MAVRPSSIPTLAAASIPVLVLWGEEDTLSPEADQLVMLEALTNGRSACILGAGHLSAVERPELVSRRMIEFLEGAKIRS
jgi:pimeloyl-ACP methyl ester carboxylesterase